MLEAVYREQRNPGAGMKPETARLILKLAFGFFTLLLFAAAYYTYLNPTEWVDRRSGAPLTESQGHWVAVFLGGLGVAFLAAIPASDHMPMYVNGKLIDSAGPKGVAWQISAAGLKNMTWGKKGFIPWSALDYVQDSSDGYGQPCFVIYLTDMPAVARYLGEEEATNWNAGVSYILEVSNTTVSMAQTRGALKQYCPSLFRYYESTETASSAEAANDTV